MQQEFEFASLVVEGRCQTLLGDLLRLTADAFSRYIGGREACSSLRGPSINFI